MSRKRNSARRAALALAAALLAPASPALAALDVGAAAPLFTLQASEGGKDFRFALSDALKRGPVVLYFFPAAFTPGCNIEAHDFAAAIDAFHKLGATVIGVSTDTIGTLDKFSVQQCQSKFPVAADTDMAVAHAYKAVLAPIVPYASRTSYVIAPDRRILYTYTDMDPDRHVANTMHAIETWRAAHRAN